MACQTGIVLFYLLSPFVDNEFLCRVFGSISCIISDRKNIHYRFVHLCMIDLRILF